MVQKLTILSGLIISTTCSILPLIPIQIQLVPLRQQIQPQEVHVPNYSFSYDVNDDHTGDVKHQQETRYGGTVTGQYSLIQPDGIRRTVDYRADDARGFQATVNNNGDNLNRQSEDNRSEVQTAQWQIQPQNALNVTPQRQIQSQLAPNVTPQWQLQPQSASNVTPQWQIQTQSAPNMTPAPMAISRSSFIQNIQSHRLAGHPWA